MDALHREPFYQKAYIALCLLACLIIGPKASIHGQIHVDQSNNLELLPENLIRNVFIGQGVKIESVQYLGANNGIGVFRNGANDINLDRGIVISTGSVETLSMSNNDDATGSSTSSKSITDDELERIAGEDLSDVAVIEIKFRPNDDIIGFNYVFGSEEYPEFVCSRFNDVFAFFINGPNPDGGQYVSHNIARIPDPNDPSGNTLTDFPVTINSVNNGVVGDNPYSDCTGEGESLDFYEYFNDNELSRTFTLDGYLDIFKARADVVPCELYTLRLAIGDAFDDSYDSAVFLEAKSFSSALHTVSVDAPGADYSMMEGCDPTIITVNRVDGSSDAIDIEYEIISGANSAVRGEDYTLNSNDLVIPAGEDSAELIVFPSDDEIAESEEYVYVVFRNSECFQDTLKIQILDHKVPEYAIPEDTQLCDGDQIILESGDAKQLNVAEKSGNFPIGDTIRGDCRSSITISDSDVKFLNEESFVQVCIDMLEHEHMGDMEIFLSSPSGHIVELSTNNGEDGGNGDGMDQLINTCFNLTSSQLINGGDQMEGPLLTNNPTYTGNFAPEQSLSSLFEGFYFPINGQWTLIIRDNKNPEWTGTLYQWSLKFNPKYQENRSYIVNGNDVVGSPILINKDAKVTEIVKQNYGCTFEHSADVSFTALPNTPSVICDNPRRDQVHIEWDAMEVDEYEVKFANGDWQVMTDTERLFDNLSLDANYSIEVRAVRNGCIGPSRSIMCSTPPCADSEIIVESIIPTSSACTDDGTVDVTLSGEDGPYRFQLNRDSNEEGMFENLGKGRVRILGFDVYGCSFQKVIEIDGPEPIELEISSKKVSCDVDIRGSASVEIEGGTGPYTYVWSNGGDQGTITKIEKGDYRVTVIDSRGCEMAAQVEVEEGDIPIISFEKEDVRCNGEPTGVINLSVDGGDGPYTYRWDDGFATVLPERKNLPAGTYEVKVEDENQCYAIEQITIEEPEAFSVFIEKEDNQCFGNDEGIAIMNTQGGTAPFEVFWSVGSTDDAITNLKSGTYGVTVTDAGGCRAESTVDITEPEETLIEFTEMPITCNGGANGSIEAVVIGGSGNYQYEWDNGRSFQAINNLTIGRYCVTATDANGCTISECYVIEEPESIELNIDPNHITCYQSTDGSMEVSVKGGEAPYRVELNGDLMNISQDGSIHDLRAGTYFVKVIDNIGCAVTDVVEIIEAPEPNISMDVKHLDCSGDSTGAIYLRYLNDASAEITWMDEKGNTYSGRTLNNLKSGEYTYTISTRIGCTLEGNVTINEPDNPLILEVMKDDISCYGDRNGLIQMNGLGGSGRYLYSLNGEGFRRSGVFNGLAAGTYDTYIQDGNGCEIFGEKIVISEPEELKISLPNDTTVTAGTDVNMPVTIEGGNGEIMYYWTAEPEQELTCTDCYDQWANNVQEDFTIRVEIEDARMCTAFAERMVFVERDYGMHVPTGFSPNGDAKNEILNVFGPDYALIKEFNIYLKNGTNIYNEYNFRPNDVRNGWDGTFKGTLMPPGIYIWTMLVEYDDGAKESFRGSAQLIR